MGDPPTQCTGYNMCHRPSSASRNSWKNDVENIVFGVKKQMFGLGTTATDLCLNFKKYDLHNAETLDSTEFSRAMGASGLFLTQKEMSAVAKAFGDNRGHIQYEPF